LVYFLFVSGAISLMALKETPAMERDEGPFRERFRGMRGGAH